MGEPDGSSVFENPAVPSETDFGERICPPDSVFTLEQPCLVDVAAQGEITVEGAKPWFDPFIESLKSFLIELLEILQSLIPGWTP